MARTDPPRIAKSGARSALPPPPSQLAAPSPPSSVPSPHSQMPSIAEVDAVVSTEDKVIAVDEGGAPGPSLAGNGMVCTPYHNFYGSS